MYETFNICYIFSEDGLLKKKKDLKCWHIIIYKNTSSEFFFFFFHIVYYSS